MGSEIEPVTLIRSDLAGRIRLKRRKGGDEPADSAAAEATAPARLAADADALDPGTPSRESAAQRLETVATPAPERVERPGAVTDREPAVDNHGVNVAATHASERPREGCQVARRGLRRDQPQDAPARASSGGGDRAIAAAGVDDLELGELSLEQGQESDTVVERFLFDRQDLERQIELAQVVGNPSAGTADRVFVVPEGDQQETSIELLGMRYLVLKQSPCRI